jgi:translation elongation factor EF-Ts
MPSYIETYNHQHRIGVLVEFRCDDAYTLRTTEFREFASDLAQHLATVGETEMPLALQSHYKEPGKTIGAMLAHLHQKLGVKVTVTRYECFCSSSI